MVRAYDIFSFEYFELIKEYSNKYNWASNKIKKNNF